MKKTTLLLLLLLRAAYGFGQTTLLEGELAITGVNATSGPDEFSFVLLAEVLNGTVVHFTDKSWDADATFILDGTGNPTLEGIVTWTATSTLACGTEIIIAETAVGSNVYTASSGTATETEDGFALNDASGDQVIAYQGALASPQFLYAFHFGNTNGWTNATDESNSAVPAGLTEGINAVAFDTDNAVYNYTVTNDQALILQAISEASNWSGHTTTRQTLGNPGPPFSCTTGCTGGDVIWFMGLWFGTANINTNVTITGTYDTNINPSFSACSLTISDGATLIVANDTSIIVQNNVTCGGNIIVESRGNLIQNNPSATFSGEGTATLNKTTAFKNQWYYYTYWSSPMTNATIDAVFPSVNTDARYRYNAANFVDNSPTDQIDDNADDWEIAAGTDLMIPGVGYAATAVELGFTPGADTVSFSGAFNTGNITVPITYDPTNLGIRWNFIGNPYPSAIDFSAFYFANASVLEGVAYFWSQASPASSENPGNDDLNYSQNDYAVYNIGTGGTAGGGSSIPNGYVPSAQGFFVPALTSLTDPSQSVTFTNAMRSSNIAANSQFYKNLNPKNSKKNTKNPVENKLWINLTTDQGVFQQILVGYVENATDAFDGMTYDATKILNSSFVAALYSTMENDDKRFVIQGKGLSSINEDEVISLGIVNAIDSNTLFKLSVEKFQGAFLSTHSIFLKDKLLGTIHNLTNAAYTFTSELGEFNDRFEIGFSAQALSTNTMQGNAATLKIIELNQGLVQFSTSGHFPIKTVIIYDLLGRPLSRFKGHSTSETYPLSHLSNTAYIAKVELSNGLVITKKMIKK